MFCLIALKIWWPSPCFPKWLSMPRVSWYRMWVIGALPPVVWGHGCHPPHARTLTSRCRPPQPLPLSPGTPVLPPPNGFRTKLFMKAREEKERGGEGRAGLKLYFALSVRKHDREIFIHMEFTLNIWGPIRNKWNGNRLQYSCLESHMDRGAWWAAVHRVAESQTRLKWLSTRNN